MIVYIYDLSDPRSGEVRYIGKSVHPRERLTEHIRQAKRGSVVHCKRWIDGLLKAGVRPALGILEEATSHDAANEAERYWIGSLRLVGADLTNRTPGGDGQPKGFRFSAEALAKRSATTRGRKLSPAHADALRAAFNRPEIRARRKEITAARMADPALRAIAARGRTGQPMPEEAKQKISAAWTPERKAAHAAEKSSLPFDERWRAQLAAALKARWDKNRAATPTNKELT